MKKLLLWVFILTLIYFHYLEAQVKLTVNSDSAEYSYGQPILLKIEILNNSDSTFMYYSCWGGAYKFDDFDIGEYIICADDMPFPLLPGRSVTWKWKIDPAILGIPNKDGVHTIVGYYGSSLFMIDTILVSAPIYYGGIIEVYFSKFMEDKVREVQDSLNANIIYQYDTQANSIERWEIKGCLIDSIINKYNKDYRFISINRYVSIGLQSIETSVPEKNIYPVNDDFTVSESYPNPFNSSTNFFVEVKNEQNILVEVFNSLGQKVYTIFNGRIPVNSKKFFTLNLNYYSSGIYLISVRSENKTLVRKIFLMK